MNWSGDVWEKRDHLFYRCWLSRLYHQKRERFFDVCDRLTQAVAMTGGMTFIVSACSPEHWVIMAALIRPAPRSAWPWAIQRRHARMLIWPKHLWPWKRRWWVRACWIRRKRQGSRRRYCALR